MAWPALAWILVRRYTPYITLPFAAVVGFLGYYAEGYLSDRHTPSTAPVAQQRQERLLLESVDSSLKKGKHYPLEVNLSPSLSS